VIIPQARRKIPSIPTRIPAYNGDAHRAQRCWRGYREHSLTLKGLHKVEANHAGIPVMPRIYIYGGGFKATSGAYLVKSGQTDSAALSVELPRRHCCARKFDLCAEPPPGYIRSG